MKQISYKIKFLNKLLNFTIKINSLRIETCNQRLIFSIEAAVDPVDSSHMYNALNNDVQPYNLNALFLFWFIFKCLCGCILLDCLCLFKLRTRRHLKKFQNFVKTYKEILIKSLIKKTIYRMKNLYDFL